jgi:hypothetical protein
MVLPGRELVRVSDVVRRGRARSRVPGEFFFFFPFFFGTQISDFTSRQRIRETQPQRHYSGGPRSFSFHYDCTA